MTLNEMRAALESYIVANWTDTPIAFDNDVFEKQEGSWIRCGLRPLRIENASLGNVCQRIEALFTIQVFTPLNIGAGEAYGLSDKLIQLFSNQVIDGVNCYQATASYIGDEGYGWFQVNVSVPCWA